MISWGGDIVEQVDVGEKARGIEFYNKHKSQILKYRTDLPLYLEEQMRFDFSDPWQMENIAEVTESFKAGNKFHFFNIKACAGVGKTSIASCLGHWFVTCFREGDSFPFGLVITDSQKRFEKATWKEFTKWYNRSELSQGLFKWSGKFIRSYEEPSEWRIATDLQPRGEDPKDIISVFNGIHGDNIFVFLDESGELSPALTKGFYQLRSSRNLKNLIIFSIGNPVFVNSLLYSLCSDGNFKNRSITGDPRDPKCSRRINKEINMDAINKYGLDDPWVQSLILGNFPNQSENTIFKMDLVEKFMNRKVSQGSVGEYATIMGVDIAESGMDKSFAVIRRGYQVIGIFELKFHSVRYRSWSKVVAQQIAELCYKFNVGEINMDGTGGYANAIAEELVTNFKMDCELFHFNENGIDNDNYQNFRAEIVYRCKSWMETGQPILVHGRNDRLREQMINTVKEMKNEKKTQIIPKKEIKANLGYSPDELDALCLTFSRCMSMEAVKFMKNEHYKGEKLWYADSKGHRQGPAVRLDQAVLGMDFNVQLPNSEERAINRSILGY